MNADLYLFSLFIFENVTTPNGVNVNVKTLMVINDHYKKYINSLGNKVNNYDSIMTYINKQHVLESLVKVSEY